jgi:hypothetical protein
MRTTFSCLMAIGVFALAGCDSAPTTPVSQAPNTTNPPPTSSSSQPILAPAPVVSSGAASTPAPAPSPATPATPEQSTPGAAAGGNSETVKAEVGVGAKGRDYGGGVITEPVKQYFGLREKIAFDTVVRAMNEYKALNDFKAPPSHEVFMTEIIEKYNIKLPQLPAGEKYVYDPETEELMVQRPRRQGGQ